MFFMLSLIRFAPIFATLLATIVISPSAEVRWQKMPLLSPEAAAAGIFPGGEGGQWPRGPVVVSENDPNFLLLPIDVGGLYRSLDAGKNWNLAMAGWNARGANGFAIDPKNANHVLGIGGNSMDWQAHWSTNSPHGLYLSQNKAENWKQVLSILPGIGGAVAFDPLSFDATKNCCTTAYFASYDLGLFRSDDGGATWNNISRQPIGMANTDTKFTLLAVSSKNGAVFLAGKTGVWRSDDRGATFQKLWDGGAVYGLSLLSLKTETIFISGAAGILRSTDGGKNWTPLAAVGLKRAKDEPVRNVTVSPANPLRMMCWVQGANWNWVRYVSQDGGANFSPIKILPGGGAILPCNVRDGYFAWHPTNPDIVYGLGGDWVTRSTDGGRTFTWWNNGYNGIMLGASFNFSAHNPDTVFLGFQDYNGAFTTNGGRTWLYRDISGKGWGGHAYGAHAVDAQVMWYGDAENWGAPRRTRISRDGGKTWAFAKDAEGREYVWKGADVSFSSPKNANILFASQWRSRDKGLTWSKMDGCDGVFIATTDGRLLGRNGKTLVSSSDDGETWQKIVEVPGGFRDVAFDAVRNRYYFASENRLKQYEKGIFTKIETPRDQYGGISVDTVAVDDASPNLIYIGGAKNIYASSATVCRSTDAGATWENLTTGSGPHEVSWIRIHPITHDVWLNGQCFGNWKLVH